VTEAIAEYSFPAATDTVTYTTIETGASITGATISNIRYIELLGSTGDASGYPIEIFETAQLHHDKRRWLNKRPAGGEFASSNIADDQTNYEDYVIRSRKFSAYTVGKSLGLFPRPGSAQILKLLYHKEYTALSDDSDTNDLLDFAYDYIVLRALRRFFMLEPESEVPLLTSRAMTESWNELQSADKMITTGHPVS
jgi:hypothetical protein